MKRPLLTLLLTLPFVLVSGPARSGESKPEDIVTYRQSLMDEAGKVMKAGSMISKGQVNRPGDMLAHATALRDVALHLGELFPAGTGPDKLKTDAKAEIWAQPDKFQAAVKVFQTETAALVDVAKAGDPAATKAQFGKVGESCGGCHDGFRVDE
jgi:cytochrome c556